MKEKKRGKLSPRTVLLALSVAAALLVISMITPFKSLLYRVFHPAAYVESLVLDTAAAVYRGARDYAVINPTLRAVGTFWGKQTEAELIFPSADVPGRTETACFRLDPVTRELEMQFDRRVFPLGAGSSESAVVYLSDEVFAFTSEGETLVFSAPRFGDELFAVLEAGRGDAVRYFGAEQASALLARAEAGIDLSFEALVSGREPAEETQKAVADLLSDLIAQASIRFGDEREAAPGTGTEGSVVELQIPASAMRTFLLELIGKAERGGPAAVRLLFAVSPGLSDMLPVLKEGISSLEEPVTVRLYEDKGRIFALSAFYEGGERTLFLSMGGPSPQRGSSRIRAGYSGGGRSADIDFLSALLENGGLEVSGTVTLDGRQKPFHMNWDMTSPGGNIEVTADGKRLFGGVLPSLYEEDGSVIFEFLPESGGGVSVRAAPSELAMKPPPEGARAGTSLSTGELLRRMGFLVPFLSFMGRL